jgi:hypothetical protein
MERPQQWLSIKALEREVGNSALNKMRDGFETIAYQAFLSVNATNPEMNSVTNTRRIIDIITNQKNTPRAFLKFDEDRLNTTQYRRTEGEFRGSASSTQFRPRFDGCSLCE